MSYQEKKSISSIIFSLIGFVIYYLYVLQVYEGRTLDLEGEFSFWAAVILIFVPVSVVIKVVGTILFAIFYAITTREELPSITDEFDRLIELKSTKVFSIVFSAGFFLAMGALVMDYGPLVMFQVMLFSMVVAGICIDLSQIYYYRRGF